MMQCDPSSRSSTPKTQGVPGGEILVTYDWARGSARVAHTTIEADICPGAAAEELDELPATFLEVDAFGEVAIALSSSSSSSSSLTTSVSDTAVPLVVRLVVFAWRSLLAFAPGMVRLPSSVLFTPAGDTAGAVDELPSSSPEADTLDELVTASSSLRDKTSSSNTTVPFVVLLAVFVWWSLLALSSSTVELPP
eukprot:CAMPEP_0115494976 /NCGR_PEP_ID=MMETSP0271-20121206/65010_1 /TAXON_ID=71861 /ORGANISM="Scrippsiella trochoidea, Strain CCMP3099" /LENGTH=193 /DNA_ID=CAMNT_0002923597 /DNA_START=82 /DNA_END=663 /DNA_ORIENTATION=+